MHMWYEFGECGSNRFRVIVLTVFGDGRTDRQTDGRDRWQYPYGLMGRGVKRAKVLAFIQIWQTRHTISITLPKQLSHTVNAVFDILHIYSNFSTIMNYTNLLKVSFGAHCYRTICLQSDVNTGHCHYLVSICPGGLSQPTVAFDQIHVEICSTCHSNCVRPTIITFTDKLTHKHKLYQNDYMVSGTQHTADLSFSTTTTQKPLL